MFSVKNGSVFSHVPFIRLYKIMYGYVFLVNLCLYVPFVGYVMKCVFGFYDALCYLAGYSVTCITYSSRSC